MTHAAAIADQIQGALPQVKSGSLVVWGDIFGGRIDNIHFVKAARAEGNPARLVVEFNYGERLEVWEPEGSRITASEFRIQRAAKVRWQWFYYGRPQTPENLYFIEHLRTGDAVTVTTDWDASQSSFNPSRDRPAVELLTSF